jgi:hypothetical protein
VCYPFSRFFPKKSRSAVGLPPFASPFPSPLQCHFLKKKPSHARSLHCCHHPHLRSHRPQRHHFLTKPPGLLRSLLSSVHSIPAPPDLARPVRRPFHGRRVAPGVAAASECRCRQARIEVRRPSLASLASSGHRRANCSHQLHLHSHRPCDAISPLARSLHVHVDVVHALAVCPSVPCAARSRHVLAGHRAALS